MNTTKRINRISAAATGEARGFSLVEVVLSLLFLAAAVVLVPSFSQQLVVVDVLWERRLASRVVETQLDKACNLAANLAGFNSLKTAALAPSDFPVQLANPIGSRQVACVSYNPVSGQFTTVSMNADGSCPSGSEKKRVQVSLQWTARSAHAMNQASADYLISQAGICGTGGV